MGGSCCFHNTRASAVQPLFAPRTSSLGGVRQVQFTARLVAF
jgi:hypothetical protein